MNTTTRRTLAVTTAGVAALALAACSGDDAAGPLPAQTSTVQATTAPADPAMIGLAGPGCADYNAKERRGAASIETMSRTPLAMAASKNPLLTSLTAAVSGKLNKQVKLVDTLNGGEYTIFAPVDAAFEKLPAATLSQFKSDQVLLTKVLTYHLVAGQLDAKAVVGTQTSVEGGDVKISRTGDALKVNGANVVCGGIRTANATVYLIDTVLTPPK